jgi:hypothetical protein
MALLCEIGLSVGCGTDDPGLRALQGFSVESSFQEDLLDMWPRFVGYGMQEFLKTE